MNAVTKTSRYIAQSRFVSGCLIVLFFYAFASLALMRVSVPNDHVGPTNLRKVIRGGVPSEVFVSPPMTGKRFLAELRQAQDPGSLLRVEDIAFGIMTCGVFHKTRLQAQQQTWMRQVRNIVAFTDEAPSEALGVAFHVDTYKPSHDEGLFRDGAWRALSIVEKLYQRYPDVKWYFLADDDTYIFASSLLSQVLNARDSSKPHYVGYMFPSGPDLKGVIPGVRQPLIAIGGAGFAISHGLMVKLANRTAKCSQDYTWDWPGDMRIAQCIEDLGFGVEPDHHFYPENLRTSLDLNNGQLENNGEPPVSFHHLTPELMHQMHSAHMVYSSDLYWRADFAPFVAKEMLHFDAVMNQNFSLRFGFMARVEAKGKQPTLLADRLLSFRAIGPAEPHDFEQEYGGDLCPRMPGRVIVARANIHCGTCKLSSRPAQAALIPEAVVCAVRALDLCTFQWHIAMPCPRWEVNALEGLDVGTEPGLSDVVHASRVSPFWDAACYNIAGATSQQSTLCALIGDESSTRFFLTLASGTISLDIPKIRSGDVAMLSARLGEESSLHVLGGQPDSIEQKHGNGYVIIVEYQCLSHGTTTVHMNLQAHSMHPLQVMWQKKCR